MLEASDLGVEEGEASMGDRFPVGDVLGIEHAGDVVERQAGVLEHADEHEPAQRLDPVATLSGTTGVRGEQALPLVEPDRRGRHTGASRDLADGQQVVVHATTLT